MVTSVLVVSTTLMGILDRIQAISRNFTYVCSILSLTVTWNDVSYHRTKLSQKTCYGNQCSSGVYHSNGYPGPYPDNLKELYLIYIPGAKVITFNIEELDIEEKSDGLFADILLLGPGLVKSNDEEEFLVRETGVITIESDSAWIFFCTDSGTPGEWRGFQLNKLDFR